MLVRYSVVFRFSAPEFKKTLNKIRIILYLILSLYQTNKIKYYGL